MEKSKAKMSNKTFTPSIHVRVNPSNTSLTKLPPIEGNKKVKFGNKSTPADLTEFLPELGHAEEIQDLESQRVQTNVAENEEVSFVDTLTHGELNEHVQICLEMSSENKINQKNAFALQLIDCMSLLTKKNKDFSAMACTLDAGAKIYSYRVDALHQQVMRLADGIILRNKEKNKDKEENDADTNPKKGLRQQKKLRKNNLIVASDTLKRQMKQVDPKDKYLRFEALPGAILSGARRDPSDLSLSLDRFAQFWPNWETYKPIKAKGTVTLPTIEIVRSKSQTKDLEQPSSLTKENPSSSIIETATDSNANLEHEETLVFHEVDDIFPDVSPSEPQSDNDGDHYSVIDETEHDKRVLRKCDEKEVDVVATAMNRLREEAEVGGARIPTRVEALKIIFDQTSEYDYLKVTNSNYWAGPEFWKRPRGRIATDNQDKLKARHKKKIPGEITYDFQNKEENTKILQKKVSSLSKNTITNWKKNKKTTLPTDLKVEVSWFLNLFHIERSSEISHESIDKINSTVFVDVLENLEETSEISDISKNPLSPVQENTTGSQDSVNAAFYEGFSQTSTASEPLDPLNSTFYSTGLPNKETGKIIKVQVSSSVSSGFGESSLIPAPKMVKFEPIKYSTRPIRVDMQHLKWAMMEVIAEELEKINMKKELQRELEDIMAKPKSGVKFKEVLKSLPMRLERRTREDLSTAIAFTAILSLTNENSLQLEKSDDGDFFVSLPDYPNRTFEEDPGGHTFGNYDSFNSHC